MRSAPSPAHMHRSRRVSIDTTPSSSARTLRTRGSTTRSSRAQVHLAPAPAHSGSARRRASICAPAVPRAHPRTPAGLPRTRTPQPPACASNPASHAHARSSGARKLHARRVYASLWLGGSAAGAESAGEPSGRERSQRREIGTFVRERLRRGGGEGRRHADEQAWDARREAA
ncbi:hypothetical protein HYPSUDRAFT_46261 [Hypholoma sublateritium FD-334 SS-4]|uniref:Uncharacterized protein n=1 Tax=Hypholoma sublateritium (strain FD-334 SS-4) TaxID=945553 RepID=A0A0D2NLG0_HYPSF|nr:hypothetical protein HYPSUDRAFT_46261 [Hypholoma sublateritium FD-334 SS-4]